MRRAGTRSGGRTDGSTTAKSRWRTETYGRGSWKRHGATGRFDASNQTVSGYMTHWLEDFAKGTIAPRTYHNYRLQIREHIVPAFGTMRLSKLDTPNIQALYTAKLRDSLKPSSVRYIHAVLHCALEKAVELRLIPRNPAASARPPKIRQEEITPLDVEQTRVLLAAAKDDRFECLYGLSLTCGLRMGEALECVMNSGENRIEMRIPRSGWFLHDLRFPHS